MFAPAELLEIAIHIEENGQRFYSRAAKSIDDQTVRLIFNHLADEEVRHQELFSGLLAEADSYKPVMEAYPGEHIAYIRTFADRLVFGKELPESELPGITDPGAAVRFGLDRETESILLYQELKELLPKDKNPVVDAIITEEKTHYTKLAGLLKSYE